MGVAKGRPEDLDPQCGVEKFSQSFYMRNNYIHKVVYLAIIVNVNVTKYVPQKCVISSFKCTKTRFRPEIYPDPDGGAFDTPRDPLMGWGG